MVGYHDPKVAVLDEGTIASISRVYADIQEKIKKLETEKQTIKDMLFNHFDLTQGKNSAAEIECGDGFKFAREIRKSKTLDETKLKEALEPSVWKSVTSTKRTIDETKLKKAISNNVINKNVVKNCVIEKKTYAFTHPSIRQEEK